MPQCTCRAFFTSTRSLHLHQAQAPACRKRRDEWLKNLWANRRQNRIAQQNLEGGGGLPLDDINNNAMVINVDNDAPDSTAYGPQAATAASEEPGALPDQDATNPRIEEVADESDEPLYWREPFPAEKGAGRAYSASPTVFEKIRDEQVLKGAEIWGPFESEDEWDLAKWLILNVGHNQAEAFLKMPIIQQRVNPAFRNKDSLLEHIDELPKGLDWKCEEVGVTGDLLDDDGQTRSENLELWFRDPVDCVRELMGNPAFRDVMRYAPERLFTGDSGDDTVTNEMWTAKWWWKIQELLPEGATVAPLILSSDKTKLSQFRGDKSAWPVYLTIGNISKDTRRQASTHATVLVGYLPVAKLDCCSDKTRSVAKYRLFHYCMNRILSTAADAGRKGETMTCADGMDRQVWPIFAAYVADYPEQCLVACCMENRCPIGKIHPDQRGTHSPCQKRDVKETLAYLQHRDTLDAQNIRSTTFNLDFHTLGLRPVYPPFWANLPYADIFQGFTPDLLHQLHKGVFKDHLVKWCTNVVGEAELDARFRSMTSHPGLRHFKNGISSVSQWTGHEHKEMEKVFLGLVIGCADVRVVKAVRATIDFIYLASLHSQTTTTLAALRQALDDFHDNKDVFIELGARLQTHFNIPKIHAMEHYVELIELFGSADGFNTESPERLHIDYAKDAYRASNKKDYVAQMTHWLRRQEAIARFTTYLHWRSSKQGPAHGGVVPRPLAASNELDADVAVVAVRSNAGGSLAAPSPTMSKPPVTFKIAKSHPAALRNIPASLIIDQHKAIQFLPALQTFLRSQCNSTFVPKSFDLFDLFKRITFQLPAIAEVNVHKLTNVVRASPPVPAANRRPAEPAHLDFAFVRTGESNTVTDGTSLQGLRVAQVRVIFKMPRTYPVRVEEPLAYIEWLTPLRAPDANTGLIPLTRSTRMHRPYAEIVPLTRIVRNCHLYPKFGRAIDNTWSADNVAEKATGFSLSPYSDTHAFCMIKVGHKNCI